MNGDDLERVIARLNGAYPGRLTGDTLTAWTEELAPLDFSPAFSAVRELVRTEERFPPIGKLIAAYNDHKRRQAGPPSEKPRCRHCDGVGFIETASDATIPTVKPCSVCNATLYDRWAKGTYLSDHRRSA